MLAYGIPEYRLPKAVLDREINTIRNIGIQIKPNTEIGKDITFAELQANIRRHLHRHRHPAFPQDRR